MVSPEPREGEEVLPTNAGKVSGMNVSLRAHENENHSQSCAVEFKAGVAEVQCLLDGGKKHSLRVILPPIDEVWQVENDDEQAKKLLERAEDIVSPTGWSRKLLTTVLIWYLLAGKR